LGHEVFKGLLKTKSNNLPFIILLCISVIFIALLAMPLAGNLAYNLYHVAMARYVHEVSMGSEMAAPETIYEWLDRSIFFGYSQAADELEHLRLVTTPQWPKTDPLLFWLGIQDWNMKIQNRSFPDSVWTFVRNKEARIEAEEMLTAGVRLPNPYVSYRKQDDETKYVALFWGLTSLEIPLVVLNDGSCYITVRAKDWPPSPLRIRIRVDNQERVLEWNGGDRTWRDKVVDFDLPRGKHTLRLTYLPPSGNKTQKASIDYIEVRFTE
jgi:hypothetical protein